MVIIMKLKNIITGVCLSVLIAVPALSTPINAYAIDDPQVFTSDGTATMEINAEVTNSWTVQMPAILVLTKKGAGSYTYEGTYNVGAKGVISNSKKVTITPTSTFTMTGTNTNNEVTATVTQPKTNFMNTISDASTDVQIGSTDFATTEGKVSVDFNKVDDYTGNVGFTFALADK